MKENIFLILGGDERSLYLGEYLEKQKLQVCYYAFSDTNCFENLSEAINSAEYIILPLPFTKDRLTLNAPLFDEKVEIKDICTLLKKGNIVIGGQLPESFKETLTDTEIEFYDYFLLDELAIFNAIPTAEGVVEILIKNLPITIHSMKCAILGYGRVGKVLAETLKSLGAEVTIFARKERDKADAFTKGYKFASFPSLKNTEYKFDALINTVPQKVLGRDEMKNISSDCLFIEIASAPFGIDFQAAKEFAFDVIKANSLPGKVAPKTAGEIIGRSILPILENKGLIL
jgi:dipicolinate synthase subunit A